MGQYRMLLIMAMAGANIVLADDVVSDVVSDSGFEEVYDFEEVSDITPEKGDKLPDFVQTFPGCNCLWNEPKWTCEGTIAHPASQQGNKCCCCGLICDKGHRCSNEACISIGVNQTAEIAAEEARIAELLKGADMLLTDELPGFVVDLGKGQCTDSKIYEKCKEKGLTPLCDHTSYSARGRCYTPGWRNSGPEKAFYNRHFSHWSSHRQLMGFNPAEDDMFYGMCFMSGANGNWALAPYTSSHAWTNGNSALTPWGGGNKNAPRNHNPYFNDVNACKPKSEGGVGCWRTICVKKDPNKNGSPR